MLASMAGHAAETVPDRCLYRVLILETIRNVVHFFYVGPLGILVVYYLFMRDFE